MQICAWWPWCSIVVFQSLSMSGALPSSLCTSSIWARRIIVSTWSSLVNVAILHSAWSSIMSYLHGSKLRLTLPSLGFLSKLWLDFTKGGYDPIIQGSVGQPVPSTILHSVSSVKSEIMFISAVDFTSTSCNPDLISLWWPWVAKLISFHHLLAWLPVRFKRNFAHL